MSTKQATDSLKMQNPTEDRFRSNDLELLDKGLYSDAQVMVGDRVWNVHKSIVCLRSGYMRDVLFHSSEEKPEPKGLPFGTTEEQAELLLEFIYTGRIKNSDRLTLTCCVELSILGQDFLVDGMVSYATSKLWQKLNAKIQPVLTMSIAGGTHQSHYKIDDIDIVHNQFFQVDFSLAVRDAYRHSDNPCQPIESIASSWKDTDTLRTQR